MNNNWKFRIAGPLWGAVAAILLGPIAPLAIAPPARAQPPAAGPRLGAPAETRQTTDVVRSYPVGDGDVAAITAEFERRYGGRVRVVPDARTRQVIVVAPEKIHEEIRLWPAILKPTEPNAELGRGIAPADAPTIEQSWKLAAIAPAEFEASLFRIWGQRAQASEDPARQIATFQLPAGPDATTSVRIDRRTAEVNFTAPERTGQSWLRLLQAIDVPPRAGGNRSAIVPVSKADPATLQRTISLLRAAAATGEASAVTAAQKRQHIGQFVGMFFQPEGNAQPAAPAPPEAAPAEGVGQAPPGDVLSAISGVGNVTIEILEGLDVVIIRGKKEDVEKVMKIIEEIERQSVETRPEVEIYYLKHVDGTALNTLIQQVYTSSFASRLGTVTITPLVKPNALMIIGRKDNIPPVIELIQKLDKSVPPQTQIRVFPLKHMSAIDAERTIRGFFVDRPGQTTNPRTGLDVQAQVIAEYRANTVIVQASPRDMAEIAKLIESLDIEGPGASNEVRVFRLRNSLAEQLAPVLQEAITGRIAGQQGGAAPQQQQQQGGQAGQGATSPSIATPPAISLQFLEIDSNGQRLLQSGILANMRITADVTSNTLIVIGPTSSMELMGALIKQLDDLPATVAELKVFTMINGDATTLVQMLQDLFSTQQQGGQGNQGGNFQTATGSGESTLVPLRFSVDQRTNSIIASGNPGDLEVVRNVLFRLDAADLIQRITTVYRLHNAPAADVATAINNLLDRQRDLNQAAPELITAYQQIEREVLIEPETVTNSLIVSATPRYFEDVKKLVTELDRRPPMVMIQVLLAEVTLTDDDQFGVEWGLQDSLLFDRGIVGGPRYNWLGAAPGNDNSAASLATRESLAGQAISDFTLNRVDPTLGFGGMVLSASSESVNVLIRALEASSRAQVISRPQVQTLDNQTAYVNVGALVPRITGGQASTIGTFNPTVEDISVGIILEVTPRTSPDGTIVMQVNATKSQVGPEATGIPIFTDAAGNVIRSPQIPITTAQTIVSAKSGQTIILGGLITKDQTETTQRIPYLGDIPVLGRLFRFDAVSNDRTELLLIMTPFIVENPEQSEWMNARESERMSWCLADIVNIHGPVGGMTGNPEYNLQPTDVIYPDLDGTAPEVIAPGMNPTGPQPIPAGPLPGPLPPMPMLPFPTPPPQEPTAPQPGGLDLPADPQSTYQPLDAVNQPVAAQPAPRGLIPQTIRPAAPVVGTRAQPQSSPAQQRVEPVAPSYWQPSTSPGVAPAGYLQPAGQ